MRGAAYCLKSHSPCNSVAACPGFGACRDVTGTGSTICHWSGGPSCRNNADCPMLGEVCGTHPEFIDGVCGNFGPCATAGDCATGFECRDLWGDGVTECVPSGGSCTSQSDCSAGAVCGVPLAGGAPRCISRPL